MNSEKIEVVNDEMQSIRKTAYLLVIPLLLSLAVVAVFYPGFMSYDTLFALRSAKNGVTDPTWPPMASYVWRVVGLVSYEPSAMHFSQVFLLLLAIFYILVTLTKKLFYATVFLLVYLSIPVVLGTVAAIWKDVLMAAFLLAGFAIIISLRFITNRRRFVALSLLSVFVIFLGVCSRHNAITGAIPLLFYLAWTVCLRGFQRPLHLWLMTVLLGSVLTIAVFSAKTCLDNYSLPDFVKMTNNNSGFFPSSQVVDIAAASVCVGSNLFTDMAHDLSLADLQSGYNPRHINLASGKFNTFYISLRDNYFVDNRINKIWMNVAVHHPICIFNSKFQLAKYLIGANEGEQFLITAPSVDSNEFGYTLPISSLRDSIVIYIIHASQLPILRPWFFYLIAITFFVYKALSKSLTADSLILFLSAILYFSGLVLLGNAADARLTFYTTTALLMFIFLSIFDSKTRFLPAVINKN
jgi:hypothetical protein